jgi:hypothetical protein
MTHKEVLASTDWHPWRKEKSRHVIQFLAALTCRQTPKSRRMISEAIFDAAKLFTLELEFEAGRQFSDLHLEIQETVMKSPATAEADLDAIVERLSCQNDKSFIFYLGSQMLNPLKIFELAILHF